MNRPGQVLGKRLSAEGVAIVVKRSLKKLGYDPAAFAGHSLRAGLATSAAAAGKSERAIMSQTGHRRVMTVRRYIRDGNLFAKMRPGTWGCERRVISCMTGEYNVRLHPAERPFARRSGRQA